jgi:hypothetical protein
LDPAAAQELRCGWRLNRNAEATWANRGKNTSHGIPIAINSGWRQRVLQGLC